MKYLHTMVRVSDLERSVDFYCDKLGLKELRRIRNEKGRYTLVFLAAPGDEAAQVELTHNWDPEAYSGGRNFGHLAYAVEDIYALCQRLMDGGVHHQPAAARRPHGVRALARWHLDRAAAERRGPAAARALGLDEEHRAVVSALSRPRP